ncbi:GlxA family transcriptional regulator [Arenimonas sp.]|uniref:GlxA family transcriptional regulator n=1 Tax=Arenimonas sp. TaxID=1872635 RepID=UPI0039E577B4
MRNTRKIVFVLFDGADLLDVTGPAAVFDAARDRDARADYRMSLCAKRKGPVRSSSGIALHADSDFARAPSAIHTLVVPGGLGLDEAMADAALLATIRRLAARAERVVSICTGAFLLAAAGLLDGRRATTHWRYANELARKFPALQVEPDAIHLRDGDIWTSAGVTAGMDLALALVEADHGQALALETARALVLYLKRPGGQSQFSVPLQAQSAEHATIERVRQAVLDRPGKAWTVQMLAERAAVSERHLRRLFQDELGMSPREFIHGTVMERAQRLLSDGDAQVAEIARRCGYGSSAAFIRRFQATLGVSPTDYRARFQSPAAGREERR